MFDLILQFLWLLPVIFNVQMVLRFAPGNCCDDCRCQFSAPGSNPCAGGTHFCIDCTMGKDVQVVLIGMANDDCLDCASLNATWNLPHNAVCTYSLQTGLPCSLTSMNLNMNLFPSVVRNFNVKTSTTFVDINSDDTFPSPQDCYMQNEGYTFVGQSSPRPCDGTLATATISTTDC